MSAILRRRDIMCRFAYNDKVCRGPWRFGRKGCRCGFESNEERCVAVLTAALCLMLVLGLQACAGSGGGRPIQDPQAGTVLPEGA